MRSHRASLRTLFFAETPPGSLLHIRCTAVWYLSFLMTRGSKAGTRPDTTGEPWTTLLSVDHCTSRPGFPRCKMEQRDATPVVNTKFWNDRYMHVAALGQGKSASHCQSRLGKKRFIRADEFTSGACLYNPEYCGTPGSRVRSVFRETGALIGVDARNADKRYFSWNGPCHHFLSSHHHCRHACPTAR